VSDFIEVNAGMEDGNTWESVHVCPNCEWVINLADIDLRTITTGIVSCPRCEWAGKVEIRIVGSSGPAHKTPDQK
jgi:ssDNA-binding Zn-finger/Zn-ribbon topoisomerase 1